VEFSTASEKERKKVLTLANALSKKLIDRPTKIELYDDNVLTSAEIIKRYDQGVVKYFLVKPTETVKVAYMQSLWEKELYKWTWSSRELNIEP
jgi:hypothetical protein